MPGTIVFGLIFFATQIFSDASGTLTNDIAPHYFAVRDHGLYQTDTRSGARRIIKSKNVTWLFDDNRDWLLFGVGSIGRHIENQGGTELVMMNKSGNDLRSITDKPVNLAILNADATEIYFTEWEHEDLYHLDLKTGVTRLLIPKATNPRLLPGEKLLVYYKINADWQKGDYFEKALGLAAHNLQTGKETLLVPDSLVYTSLLFPIDSGILISNDGEDGKMHQFRLSPKGDELVPLSAENHLSGVVTDMIHGSEQTWSADDRWLAYTFDDEIFISALDHNKRSMSKPQLVGYGTALRWENDGRLSFVTFDPRPFFRKLWREFCFEISR